MDEEQPRYGYGKGLRPLTSPRDREAEAIWRVLRRARLRRFGVPAEAIARAQRHEPTAGESR